MIEPRPEAELAVTVADCVGVELGRNFIVACTIAFRCAIAVQLMHEFSAAFIKHVVALVPGRFIGVSNAARRKHFVSDAGGRLRRHVARIEPGLHEAFQDGLRFEFDIERGADHLLERPWLRQKSQHAERTQHTVFVRQMRSVPYAAVGRFCDEVINTGNRLDAFPAIEVECGTQRRSPITQFSSAHGWLPLHRLAVSRLIVGPAIGVMQHPCDNAGLFVNRCLPAATRAVPFPITKEAAAYALHGRNGVAGPLTRGGLA